MLGCDSALIFNVITIRFLTFWLENLIGGSYGGRNKFSGIIGNT